MQNLEILFLMHLTVGWSALLGAYWFHKVDCESNPTPKFFCLFKTYLST